jgi:molybdenum cofactor biosynthesis enzyme MoaA
MSIRTEIRQVLAPWLSRHSAVKRSLVAAETSVGLIKHSIAAVVPAIIQPTPRNLTVAITANCNLRCVGCRYGRDFMNGSQLSWPMMRDLLDDARQGGIEHVRLYGGEPLLHRDLPKMVEYCCQIGLTPYVTTNAILLEQKIDALYAAGLRAITVGFYGVGAYYDAYVQRDSHFSRLNAGIAAVRDRYGMDVALQMNWLLMRPSCNQQALREAWKFADLYSMPMQVDLIHYSLPYFTEGPDRLLQFRPEDRLAIEEVVTELVRLKRSRPEMITQSAIGLASIPEWLIKGPEMKVPCDKYQMIWVGADGTVQLCYVTFKLGNLHEKRLSQMLFRPEHKSAARDAFALKCPNCHCGYDSRVQKSISARRHLENDLVRLTTPRTMAG